MTSQKVQAPQVNLKERIAAFQQRNVSSHQRQLSVSPSASASASPPNHSPGLRDKIAQFEQKGGVPVPRGSFGLGAPPVVGGTQSRRINELYGNRIPSVLRSTSAPLSRSGSPLPSGTFTPTGRGRSPFEDDDPTNLEHSPSSSPLSGFPSPTSSPELVSSSHSHLFPTTVHTPESSPFHSPTTSSPKSSFTRALDIARRAVNASDVVGNHRPLEITTLQLASPLPVRRLSQPVLPGKGEVHLTSRVTDLPTSSPPAEKGVFWDMQKTSAAEDLLGSAPTSRAEAKPLLSTQSFTGEVQGTPATENRLTVPEIHMEAEQLISIQSFAEEPVSHDVSVHVLKATEPVPMDISNITQTSFDNLSATLCESDMTHAVEVREPPFDRECAQETTVIHEEVPIHCMTSNVTEQGDHGMVFSDDYKPQSRTTLTPQISVVSYEGGVKEVDLSHPEAHIDASVKVNQEVNEPEQSASLLQISTLMGSSQEAVSSIQTVATDIPCAVCSISPGEDTPAESVALDSPIVEISSESNEQTEISVNSHHNVADVKESEVPSREIGVSPDKHYFQLIHDQLLLEDEISDTGAEITSRSSEDCCDITGLVPSSDNTDLDTASNGVFQEIKMTDVSIAVDASPEIHNLAFSDHVEDPTFLKRDISILVDGSPHVPKPPISDPAEDPVILGISIMDGTSPQVPSDPVEGPMVFDTPPASTSPRSLTPRPLLTKSPNTSHDSFLNPAPTVSTLKPSDANLATPPVSPAAGPNLMSDHEATGSLKPWSPESESEFGTVSKHTYLLSYSQSSYAEPDFASNLAESDSMPLSFSAVVHRKVTEIPSSTSPSPLDYRRQPVTPQMPRVRRPAIVNVVPPQSPAPGELVVLLKDAALLEKKLLEGDIPSDHSAAAGQRKATQKGTGAPDNTYLFQKASTNPKSSEQRTRPIFHRALSSPSAAKTVPRSRSADCAPEKRSSDLSRPLTGGHSSLHGHLAPGETYADANETPSNMSTKSFRRRYFSSFRRLASASGSIPGIFPRKSLSTSSDFSSEDSTSVATPPDNTNPNFAGIGQYLSSVTAIGPSLGAGLTSLSLNKNAGLSRAGSFAERIWKRGRTKSFSGIGDAPAIQSQPPGLPPLFVISASSDAAIVPNTQPDRPMSYVSAGSTSSSSPLDNELFDAFPPVPESPPVQYNGRHSTSRQPLSSSPDDENTPTPTQHQILLPIDDKPSSRIAKMPIGPRSASKQTEHARLEP